MASQMLAWRVRGKEPAPGGIRPGRSADDRRWQVLVAVLAASWATPVALNAVRLDLVLLPILVLSIASTVRIGGVLLDRLVASGLLLCGALLILGLLASVWPWGLSPVPVSGVLLSAVGGAAWWSGRKPSLPWRVRGTDAVVLGTAAVVWHYVHHPIAGKSPVERLGALVTAEDRLTHLSIFDTIHRVGGYAFLHQDAARVSLQPPTEAVYPEGSHLVLAWLDVFRTSSTELGSMIAADNRYFTYVLAAYALLCAAVVWAARWVGGPRLRGWRAAVVCSTVAAVMIATPAAIMIPAGFDSELIGLLFLVVAVALLVRSAMGRTEFVLVGVAGMVTVAYTYNIYAVYIGAALLAALVVDRRRFRPRRTAIWLSLVVGGAVALVPSVIMVLSDFDVKKQAVTGGAMIPMDRSTLVGLGLLGLVAGLMPRNRRIGAVQSLLLTVVSAWGLLLAFAAFQIYETGKLSYYFEKMAVGGLMLALVALGGAGYVLRPIARNGFASRSVQRWTEPVAAVAAAAAALSLFGGIQWGVPSVGGKPSAWHESELARWGRGEHTGKLGPAAEAFATRDIQRVSTPVLTLYTNDGYSNWRMTFFAQTLLHRAGVVPQFDEMLKVQIGGRPEDEQKYRDSLAHLRIAIGRSPVPPTLLVGDKQVADRLDRDLNGTGTRTASVLYAPLEP